MCISTWSTYDEGLSGQKYSGDLQDWKINGSPSSKQKISKLQICRRGESRNTSNAWVDGAVAGKSVTWAIRESHAVKMWQALDQRKMNARNLEKMGIHFEYQNQEVYSWIGWTLSRRTRKINFPTNRKGYSWIGRPIRADKKLIC